MFALARIYDLDIDKMFGGKLHQIINKRSWHHARELSCTPCTRQHFSQSHGNSCRVCKKKSTRPLAMSSASCWRRVENWNVTSAQIKGEWILGMTSSQNLRCVPGFSWKMKKMEWFWNNLASQSGVNAPHAPPIYSGTDKKGICW